MKKILSTMTILFCLFTLAAAAQPDVKWKTGITYVPANPTVGTNVTFSATLRCLGDTATNVKVIAKMDGVKVWEQVFPQIDIYQSLVLSFNWTATAGDHQVKMIIDPDGTLNDTDLNNNHTKLNFTIDSETGEPPIHFATIKAEAHILKLPDLKASLIINPWPTAGGKMGVTLKVTNIGQADAPASTLAIKYGNHPPQTWPVPLLQPGKHYSIMDKKQVPGAGYYMITGYADHSKAVTESDETNNTVFKKVKVKAPELKFTLAKVNKASVYVQQEVKIYGTVKNTGKIPAGPFKIQANFQPCKGIAQGYRIKNVSGLGVGKTVDFAFKHRFACLGSKSNYVLLDPDNTVMEENEKNNITLKIPISVKVIPDKYWLDQNYVMPD